ncbi:MAG: hypothetical protein GQ574_27090 [Crocinitomix sp.]|nr:hypothetical protein [Crocinitomix sp.]
MSLSTVDIILIVFTLFIAISWLWMANKLYRRRGAEGLLIFFVYCFLAVIIVAVIWMIIIFPVFMFEDGHYPIFETALFFVIIIKILGIWPFLVDAYMKRNPIETDENEEVIESVSKSVNKD